MPLPATGGHHTNSSVQTTRPLSLGSSDGFLWEKLHNQPIVMKDVHGCNLRAW